MLALKIGPDQLEKARNLILEQQVLIVAKKDCMEESDLQAALWTAAQGLVG